MLIFSPFLFGTDITKGWSFFSLSILVINNCLCLSTKPLLFIWSIEIKLSPVFKFSFDTTTQFPSLSTIELSIKSPLLKILILEFGCPLPAITKLPSGDILIISISGNNPVSKERLPFFCKFWLL